jgi:hypothetical protein
MSGDTPAPKSATLSEAARDTRDYFLAHPEHLAGYPAALRHAAECGQWERAADIEARHAERWLTRLCRKSEELSP